MNLKKKWEKSKKKQFQGLRKSFLRKKGQVWVETVIYTLIAFVLIGLALSFAKPKIEQMQDSAILDQSMILLQGIDNTITEIVEQGAGNKRKLGLGIKKGSLIIDGKNDLIMFEMDSAATYTEPDINITEGHIIINTLQMGEFNKVTMSINYTERGYNLTFKGEDKSKIINHAPKPYNFFLTNEGEINGKNIINIEVE